MTPLTLITLPAAVNEYLIEHDLTEGYAPIEAVLLQPQGTTEGNAAIMLAVRVGEQLVLAKTTLLLLDAAVTSMSAVVQLTQGSDDNDEH